VQASVFYSRIDDLIQGFYVQPNVSQQRNIGQASSAGLELDARTRPADWLELSANYTFLDRDNLSDPAVPLTDTPAHKGMVAVSVTPVAAVRVSATLEYDAGRQTLNEAGKLFDVPSFALLGVKATWTVWKGLDLDVSVVNLTDRNYWTAEGYPEAGRVVLAGGRFRF
jgi:iron complex outermembrane receptor protein